MAEEQPERQLHVNVGGKGEGEGEQRLGEAGGAGARWRTPYLRYLHECVQHARHSQVFPPRLLHSLQLSALSELSQCLLANLLMRTGEWHRSDRLLACMPRDLFERREDDVSDKSISEERQSAAEEGLQEALKGLHKAGMMETLNEEHSFDVAWKALTDCCFADEIRLLFFNLCKYKAKGDKREVLNCIHKAAKTSRDLFKRPISLYRQISNVLKTKSGEVTLVRLSPSFLVTLRRMQRIMQMASASGEVSSGRSSFTVRRPLHFNAAMLSIVGKIRFPLYKILSSAPSFPSQESFVLWEAANELRSCFDEVLSLLNRKDRDTTLSEYILHPCQRYDSNEEIGTLLFGLNVGSLTPIHKIWVLAIRSRILDACFSFDSNLKKEITQSPRDTSASNVKSSRHAENGSVVDLTASDDEGNESYTDNQQLRKGGTTNPSVVFERIFAIISIPEQKRKSDDELFHHSDLVSSVGFSLLSYITICASSCLIAYLRMHVSADDDKLTHKLPFLNQLDAGNLLTALCFDGVEMMEKEIRENKASLSAIAKTSENSETPLNNSMYMITCSYILPIQILRLLTCGDYSLNGKEAMLLLESCQQQIEKNQNGDSISIGGCSKKRSTCALVRRYCSRRLGKTLERLCIDLEHEGLMTWSLLVASAGLQDSDVQTSYHIGLNKRKIRLQQTLNRKKFTTPILIVPSLEHVMCEITAEGELSRNAFYLPPSLDSVLTNTSECSKDTSVSLNQPAPSSGAPTSSKFWTCPGCTLLNTITYWKCTLCHTNRVEIPARPPNSSHTLQKSEERLSQHPLVDLDNDEDEDEIFETMSVKACDSVHNAKGLIRMKRLQKCKGVIVSREEVVSIERKVPIPSQSIDYNCNSVKKHLEQIHDRELEGSKTLVSPDDYCVEPLGNADLQNIIFNNLKYESTPHFFSSVVDTVVISGRRLGSIRLGKNKLIGVSGDAVSVEKLVMQTMEMEYEDGVVSIVEDSTRNEEFNETPITSEKLSSLKHFCGGWVGWHCEGSILRSIFGLMMWSEIFPTSDQTSNLPSKLFVSAAKPVVDVFRTPYQDAPLDLLTPGGLFYRNRQESIERKLRWIKSASNSDLIAYLGEVYRENFKSRCLCVSWSHPLKTLQLVAVSLHSSGGVHGICQLMCADYRQFSSGAPDLLMIRGYIITERSPKVGDSESEKNRNEIKKEQFLSRDSWNECLGEGWETLGGDRNSSVIDDDDDLGIACNVDGVVNDDEHLIKPQGIRKEAENCDECTPDVAVVKNPMPRRKFFYVGGKRKYIKDSEISQGKSNKKSRSSTDMSQKSHHSIFFSRPSAKKNKNKEKSIISLDSESDDERTDLIAGMAEKEEEKLNVLDEGDDELPEEDAIPIEKVKSENKTLTNEMPLRRAFQCHQENIVLPVGKNDGTRFLERHERNDEDVNDVRNASSVHFECMLVEVKGPSDRLSDRQRIWCQALAAHGIGVKVCRVHEGEGGVHVTAGID